LGAAAGVVGQGAAGKPGGAGQAVGDALDQPEGGGGGAQGGGEEVGEQGGGDLVADVGQEAGRADASYPGPSQRFLVSSLESAIPAVFATKALRRQPMPVRLGQLSRPTRHSSRLSAVCQRADGRTVPAQCPIG
jgi:hypothetical protein